VTYSNHYQPTTGRRNRDIENEVDELTSERSELQHQCTRGRLKCRQAELDDEIEAIEPPTERREEAREDIEAVETKVEGLESDTCEQISNLHREANQLECDIGSLEDDLDRVENNITRIEDLLNEKTKFKTEREALDEHIVGGRPFGTPSSAEYGVWAGGALTDCRQYQPLIMHVSEFGDVHRIVQYGERFGLNPIP
jgi:predicted  nucleic acid-binding Zn-ribbon protein